MYNSVMGIPDHKIVAINRGKGKNASKTIVYKDKHNQLHEIDLEVCAENFQREYGTANGRCVGDRNITRGYFWFHTSGMKTTVSFKKMYVFNMSGRKLMSGNRTSRFVQFEKLLSQLGYTTYDMS